MPSISSYSGIDVASIAKISGIERGGSGGTASTTPTISLSGGTFGSVKIVVTNHSSYTNPNYECVVDDGSITTVSDANVDHVLESDGSGISDTMNFVDSNSSTSTRTVTVKAQEFGDNIQSAAATTTFNVVYAQHSYLRIRGVTSTGQDTSARLAIEEIGFFTGNGATGTEYPTTDLTSNTSETGIKVSAGHSYSATYDAWKAADSSASSMWWALATTAANNWWQIEFESATYTTAPTIKSLKVRFDNQSDAAYFSLKGSNTGAFSGEETDYGVFPITENTDITYG